MTYPMSHGFMLRPRINLSLLKSSQYFPCNKGFLKQKGFIFIFGNINNSHYSQEAQKFRYNIVKFNALGESISKILNLYIKKFF